VYARSEDLEGARPALKSIHINRSPLTMPAKMLTPEVAARAQLDLVGLRDHLKQLQALVKADANKILALVKGVYDVAREPHSTDPEWDLYGGFFGESDRQLMDRVRASTGASLAKQSFPFEDPRLPDLLFRYRARNFPESLGSEERSHWQEYCFERITRDDLGVLHLERLLEEIAVIREVSADDPQAMKLMDSLEAYTDTLLAQEY
jgi:exodeoxyribonuclease-1